VVDWTHPTIGGLEWARFYYFRVCVRNESSKARPANWAAGIGVSVAQELRHLAESQSHATRQRTAVTIFLGGKASRNGPEPLE